MAAALGRGDASIRQVYPDSAERRQLADYEALRVGLFGLIHRNR